MTQILRKQLGLMALAGLVFASACESTPTPTLPTPTTQDFFFGSQLMAGGASMRSFKVAKAGEVKVTFTSLLPDVEGVVSVSLGTFDGTTCAATTTVATKAGQTTPIITTTLAVGDYCVRLADPGVLTRTNDFSVTVTVPFG